MWKRIIILGLTRHSVDCSCIHLSRSNKYIQQVCNDDIVVIPWLKGKENQSLTLVWAVSLVMNFCSKSQHSANFDAIKENF